MIEILNIDEEQNHSQVQKKQSIQKPQRMSQTSSDQQSRSDSIRLLQAKKRNAPQIQNQQYEEQQNKLDRIMETKMSMGESRIEFVENKSIIRPLRLKLKNSYTNTCYNSFRIKNLRLSQNYVPAQNDQMVSQPKHETYEEIKQTHSQKLSMQQPTIIQQYFSQQRLPIDVKDMLRSKEFTLSDDYKKMYDLKRKLTRNEDIDEELSMMGNVKRKDYMPDLPKNRSVGQLLRSTSQQIKLSQQLMSTQQSKRQQSNTSKSFKEEQDNLRISKKGQDIKRLNIEQQNKKILQDPVIELLQALNSNQSLKLEEMIKIKKRFEEKRKFYFESGEKDQIFDIFDRNQVLVNYQIFEDTLGCLIDLNTQLQMIQDTNLLKDTKIQETQKKLASSIYEYFKTKANMISLKTVSNQVRINSLTKEEKEKLESEEKAAQRQEQAEGLNPVLIKKFRKGFTVMKSIMRLGRGWKEQTTNRQSKIIYQNQNFTQQPTNRREEEEQENKHEQLNVNSNDFDSKQWAYIVRNRKMYLEDIMPFRRQMMELYYQLKSSILQRNTNYELYEELRDFIKTVDDPIWDNMDDEKFQLGSNGYEDRAFFEDQIQLRDEIQRQREFIKRQLQKYRQEMELLDTNQFIKKNRQHHMQYLSPEQNQLSEYEIQRIWREFKEKNHHDRDYVFLEQVMSRLSFFKKYSKQTRNMLLSLGQIMQFPKNHFVFRQGDRGDLMYIIIRGACHVRMLRNFEDGHQENVVLTTLYDGQSFGELSLMNYNRVNNYEQVLGKLVAEGKKLRISNIKKELQAQDKTTRNQNLKSTISQTALEGDQSREDITAILQKVNRNQATRAASIEIQILIQKIRAMIMIPRLQKTQSYWLFRKSTFPSFSQT